MVQIAKENVAPFVSLLLARTEAASGDKKHVGDVMADVKAIIESIDDEVRRTLMGVGSPSTRSELTSGFLHYEERRRPTWLRGDPPDVFDFVNHAIVICQKGELLVFCSTSKAYQDEISRAIRNKTPGLKTVDDLSLLDNALLNAAVIGPQARTLWLSGLHRRTAVKADNKILSGINLRDALSPVGDQTYTFSAVRSQLDSSSGIAGTVGVTPRKAALWTRPSKSWDDFQGEVGLIIDHIASAVAAGKTELAPLPILATPVGASDVVEGAYDMTVVAPELLADDPAAPTPDPMIAGLAYDTRFDVTPLKGPSFRAKVIELEEEIGTLEFQITVGDAGAAVHTVDVVGKSTTQLEFVKEACTHLDWLTIYYESAHVLNAAQLYRPQFRDQQFRPWVWEDFSGYRIKREKPLSGKTVLFDKIGEQDSLFCWTIKNWSVPTDGGTCWIACDDGANEVADFIALTAGGAGDPLLSLIHVKGSHSTNANRDLSTSAFEVVVGQAVKNLRSLERRNLIEVLEKGGSKATKRFAWTNRQREDDRTAMIEALQDLGANYDREVVIIQPSARKNAYLRAAPAVGAALPGWYYRRAQLSTLLLEAELACNGAGARLRVIADDS